MSYSIADLFGVAHPAYERAREVEMRIRDALVQAKALAPDFAASFDARIAEVDARIAALDAEVDHATLIKLGTQVIAELGNPSRWLRNPTSHPHATTGG